MDTSHLNSAQLRVQSIKEYLKNHDVLHLETFIDGIGDPEPPDYRKINGKIQPSLAQVTLKESAMKYDMGNVFFPDEGITERIILTMEKGEVEAYNEDAYPKDPNNPLSSPILDAIFMSLTPLWKAKYEAIVRRMDSINQVRVFAHNAPHQPEKKFSYGKSVSKLMHHDDSPPDSTTSPSRKRAIGDPISRHPVNKRKRIGLSSIPDTVKSQTFTTIPEHFKIQLFNVVAHVAFPNFDNLVMAAWNVVSIYEHVGTEFPEFHRAITDLKTVLQEFDATYRKERLKARKDEKESLERGERVKSDTSAADQASLGNGVPATIVDVPDETDTIQVRQPPLSDHHLESQDQTPNQTPNQTPTDAPAHGHAPLTPLTNDAAATSPTLDRSSLPESQIHAQLQAPPTPNEDEVKKVHLAHLMRLRQEHDQLSAQLFPGYEGRAGGAGSPKLGSEHVGVHGNGSGSANSNSNKHRSNRSLDHVNTNGQLQSPTSSARSSASKNPATHDRETLDAPTSTTTTHPGAGPGPRSLTSMYSSSPSSRQNDTTVSGIGHHDRQHGHTHSHSQMPQSVYLGNSKLGRPKGTAGGSGMAPEAPMVHNGPLAGGFKKEGGGSGNGGY